MSTVIDDLLVSLGFDADTSGANRFDSSLNNVLGTVGKLGSAMIGAGTLVTGALAGMAISTAQSVDETQRLAQIANATTQELQYLTAGAERYGMSQEKISDILKDVNDKVGDFLSTGGGQMKDFFETVAPKVGVTADMFQGLSGPQALGLYYDTLEKANVSQAEMVFYLESIGNDATGLIPLLKNGGEEFKRWGDAAEAAGLVMSDAVLAENRAFIDNMARAKLMWSGLLAQITQRSMPFLNDAMEWVIAHEDDVWAVAESIGDAIDMMADFVISNSDYIIDAFWFINDVLFDLWDAAMWAVDAFYSLTDALGIAGYEGSILAGIAGLLIANLVGLAAVKTAATIIAIWRAFVLLFSPLALIGGALLAFFFIAEDIYGYLNGKDSLVGTLIKDYPQIQYVVNAIVGLVDAIKRLWTDNAGNFAALFEAIGRLYTAFEPVINLVLFILPYAFEAMLLAVTMIINSISLVVQGWVLIFTGVVNAITAIWSGFWAAVRAIAFAVIDNVTGKIQAMVGVITGAMSMMDKLNNFSPTALGNQAGNWLKNRFAPAPSKPSGFGGGGAGGSVVNQTFNVGSSKDASNIARNSLSNTRARNTGVKQ